MSGFGVSIGEIHDTAVSLGGVGEDLRAGLGSLAAEVDALVEDVWRGAAASAVARAWVDWECGARNAVGALEIMSNLLRASGAAYDQGEGAAQDAVSIAGRMP